MLDPSKAASNDTADPRRGDRAVSDVVAFVFVFSIIITSVGVVTVVGFDVLQSSQASEQALNAERAFESLGRNIANIQRDHAPGRAGEVKLGGASLTVERNDPIQVEADGEELTAGPTSGDRQVFEPVLGALVYDMRSIGGFTGGEVSNRGDGIRTGRPTTIGFEGNAVFRSDRGNPVMRSEPGFVCSKSSSRPDRAIVSVVELVSTDGAVSTGGTVQVVGREDFSRLYYAGSDADSVSITIEEGDTRYYEAWKRHFENAPGWTDPGTGSSFTTTCDVGSDGVVVVRHTRIRIDFVT